MRDPIEKEYERAILMASDTDVALELAIGLAEYKALYQVDEEESNDDARGCWD